MGSCDAMWDDAHHHGVEEDGSKTKKKSKKQIIFDHAALEFRSSRSASHSTLLRSNLRRDIGSAYVCTSRIESRARFDPPHADGASQKGVRYDAKYLLCFSTCGRQRKASKRRFAHGRESICVCLYACSI